MRVQDEHLTLPGGPTEIGPYLRVVMTGGVCVIAAATDLDIGTTERRYKVAGLGSGQRAGILANNAPGSRKCIAAGAIAIYTEVFTADAGKVNDAEASGSRPYGLSLTASTADGDEIEILTYGGPPS